MGTGKSVCPALDDWRDGRACLFGYALSGTLNVVHKSSTGLPMKLTFSGAYWVARKIWQKQQPQPYIVRQECNGGCVFGFGSGSETGFDISYGVAHEVLTSIADLVCEKSLPVETAIEKAQISLTEKYPIEESIFPVSCTLTIGKLQSNRLELAWLGSEEVYLIRDGAIAQRTVGHSLANLHPDTEWPDHFKHNPYRMIRAELQELQPLSTDTWSLQPGDRIVFVARQVLKSITTIDLPTIVGGKTPRRAARALIDATSVIENRWGAAALVVDLAT